MATKKFINIRYSYYRKLLRDSYRLTTLKGLGKDAYEAVKKFHNILKRTDETDKGRKDTNVDLNNLCGKPHNNGEDSCLECEVIKKDI